jgi:hypothetical protein
MSVAPRHTRMAIITLTVYLNHFSTSAGALLTLPYLKASLAGHQNGNFLVVILEAMVAITCRIDMQHISCRALPGTPPEDKLSAVYKANLEAAEFADTAVPLAHAEAGAVGSITGASLRQFYTSF